MKILVTGSTGMVGRNILENSHFLKYEIISPKREQLDLFNFSEVLTFFKKHQPDLIINTAGRVGGIQANITHPVSFLVENIDINRNVIYAAYQAGIKKMINLGSSCMYPKDAQNPLKEELILKGELEPTNEGYALAKIFSQRLCAYIKKEQPEFNYKTVIPCNLYGRFDKFDPLQSHLIPAIVRKIAEAQSAKESVITIWGDGTVRREFMYAGDLVDCLAKGVEEFESMPDLMNIGLGFDHCVNDYYEATAAVLGYKGSFYHDLSKPVGMKQKLVSIDRLQNWGWRSQTSLHEGIQKTYQYFLSL